MPTTIISIKTPRAIHTASLSLEGATRLIGKLDGVMGSTIVFADGPL